MSTQEVFVQQFAQLFQHYENALLPEGPSANDSACASWKGVSASEKNRLVAAARLAILELETNANLGSPGQRYFATPGEAEWGC